VLSKRAEFLLARAIGVDPVVTYATWRTASSSAHEAIRAAGAWPCVKAHGLQPDTRFLEYASAFRGRASLGRRHAGDEAVSGGVLRGGGRAKWVIMVRDPLAIAASLLVFESASHPARLRDALAARAAIDFGDHGDDLRALVARAPIEVLDRWFELDVLPSLGWSPLGEPFDVERGWSRSECRWGPVLTLRADIAEDAKGSALSEFLGRDVQFRRSNSASAHGQDRLHHAIIATVAQDPDLIERSAALRSSRHFWSADGLARLRGRWLSKGAAR
jgi:hypothetical protein